MFKLTKLGKENIRRLKELKVLIPFLNAAFAQRQKEEVIVNICEETYELINFSFHWANTKEGHKFWERQDNKLRRKFYEETHHRKSMI